MVSRCNNFQVFNPLADDQTLDFKYDWDVLLRTALLALSNEIFYYRLLLVARGQQATTQEQLEENSISQLTPFLGPLSAVPCILTHYESRESAFTERIPEWNAGQKVDHRRFVIRLRAEDGKKVFFMREDDKDDFSYF
ncbi:hypothetical protein AK812_SmicGene46931 [Symbiodinium microadriaticum]|uniref:Uncharacterized protein n=1 Tax=Symbiodinium microadriaticum TaxID=2951 RepID=A0A1Q9BSQ8_SYMMI|nr:hypothetical protein AK812_SmicGene46931 [Symbiodinium microadriaticum]